MTIPGNPCGECSACCRVFAVPEVKKSTYEWCQHCEIGHSCKIYETRPDRCKDYRCMWREMYDEGMNPPLDLRPDKSKVVFSMTTSQYVVNGATMPNYADAWKKPIVKALIDRFIGIGLAVVIGPPGSIWRTFIDGAGIKQVEMTPPDEDGMQWNVKPQKEI